MQLVKDPIENLEYIDTRIIDLSGIKVSVVNMKGFGGKNVSIGGHEFTWEELDRLKKAISWAKDLWKDK